MGSDTSSARVALADRLGFIGFAFLAVYGALVLLPLAFLVAGVSLAGWMVPLAVVGAGIGLYLLAERDRIKSVGVSLVVVGGVWLIGAVVAVTFYDASVDGRWYHQSAVINLSNGWNPISEAYPGAVSGVTFVRSYPKAFWIAAASLYQLFDSVEVGKSLHFMPLGASFFLTLSLLIRLKVRTGLAITAAALAAANPIWILESLTFYLDGQIASLILVAVVSVVWMTSFGPSRVATISLAASLILLVNLKFTGLLYAGLILLALGAILLWQRRWVELRRAVAVQSIALAIALGVVGFNPYVQNTLDFGNPFFPVYGEDSIDFITPNTPQNLRGASQPVQLAYGIFGKPANLINTDAQLAVPFSPANLSIEGPYTGTGARIAGLGPLFSGALLMAGAGLLWYAVRERRRTARLLVGLVVLFLAITVVAHPEGWWARYTPQLWLIPVVIIVAAWTMNSSEARWVGAALSLVLLLNLVYVTRPYLKANVDFTRDVRRMYEPFVENSEVMALYLTRYGESTVVQMKEAGVTFARFRSVETLPCASPVPLANYAGQYCPPGEADTSR